MKNLVLKYCYLGFNILLIILIGVFAFMKSDNTVLATTSISKSLNTTKLPVTPVEVPKVEIPLEQPPEVVENPVQAVEEVQQQVVSTTPPASVVQSDVLETQVGTMSAYGPDCAGCSGYLANGHYAGGGNIYYEDATYGVVRIVAGDRHYKTGSIIKVSGSKLGDFNAIVLDRGGGIGFGKRFLFDLLFASEAEASQFGTSYDVVFELLRDGY